MPEDPATPPSAAERERLRERLQGMRTLALIAAVLLLWALVELGGDWGESLVGWTLVAIFAGWAVTWPFRKVRAWRRRRARRA